jgi:hypothetical protein
MYLATIFILCLRLGASPNPLLRANAVLISILQNTAPTAGDNTGASKNPAPPLASSEGPASQQPASHQSSPTSTPKKAPASSIHKKKRSRKPSKVVVRNGGAADPSTQFSTGMSPEQASQERRNTAGLLAITNSNLQKVSGRQLNPTQQDMLKQVRSYMVQAKSADEAGDLQSAHNLALKAQLLSTELIRR